MLGADLVGGYTSLVKGQDVDASCTEDGVCTINISNFPIKLSTPCTVGDCLSKSNGVFKQGTNPQVAGSQFVGSRAYAARADKY